MDTNTTLKASYTNVGYGGGVPNVELRKYLVPAGLLN